MRSKVEAIERCAYCRSYVPVTPIRIGSPETSTISATVAVCEPCQTGGR